MSLLVNGKDVCPEVEAWLREQDLAARRCGRMPMVALPARFEGIVTAFGIRWPMGRVAPAAFPENGLPYETAERWPGKWFATLIDGSEVTVSLTDEELGAFDGAPGHA